MWQRVLALARRQHGVASSRQLIACGMSSATVARYRRRGHLHRVHRGVHAVGRPQLSRKGEYMAAVLAGGSGAVLSHTSAAGLHGMRPDGGGRVHVTVRHHRRNRRGIVFHESHALTVADVTVVDGIPVTGALRTAVDLGDVVSRGAHEQAVAMALRLDLLSEADLDGLPGRRALDRAPSFTRSGFERRLLSALREHDLPAPQTNQMIGGYEVDYLWRCERLAVELDPWQTHRGRARHDSDREKQGALMELGIRVHRVSDRQVDAGIEAVIGRIVRLLRLG